MKGQFVDIPNQAIYAAEIITGNGKILAINRSEKAPSHYILPGFIDAHIHIESSMLIPSEFAKVALTHGTVATVSDPHEIANVLGIKGVEFMIENGNTVPLKFNFGAPSCVPATTFETAGAAINSKGIEELLKRDDIKYLAEMMNYPGVLHQDEEVMTKIAAAGKYGKPVDGHAPGLKGNLAEKYIAAGISTDHECFTAEEALDKLKFGMKILIREGSAAKNFEALIPLLNEHYKNIMFCSDDKHPDDLLEGHINKLVARAIAKGNDLFKVLRAACINPIEHYDLDVGQLRTGDPADFIVTEDFKDFKVLETYIDGVKVAEQGKALFKTDPVSPINHFNTEIKKPSDFEVKAHGTARINCIEALDGELITRSLKVLPKILDGNLVSDIDNDILKITVVNRYENVKPAIAFIKNFGLKDGAIASCVGHDSHNIIAVGVSDDAICEAVNAIIDNKGGLSAVGQGQKQVLPLPVAGIMSPDNGEIVAQAYSKIDQLTKSLGCKLSAPFMTLSFMALLVIPSLKLSDRGLFDGDSFEFVPLQNE